MQTDREKEAEQTETEIIHKTAKTKRTRSEAVTQER